MQHIYSNNWVEIGISEGKGEGDDRLSQMESVQNIPLPLRELWGDITGHLIQFLRLECQVSTYCSNKSAFHHLTSALYINYIL